MATLGVACALSTPPPVQAQVPAAQSKSAKSEATAVAMPGAASADEVRGLLEDAKKQLETLEAAGEAPADAPPGTPRTEIVLRLTLARALANTYEKQLNALEKLEAVRTRQAAVTRANEAWRGFDQPPPYPVLMVDRLRDELDAARDAQANANASAALFHRLESDYAAKQKTSQAAARLAAEAADRARGTPSFPEREWERSLAALTAAVDAAVEGLLQTGLRGAQAELQTAEAETALVERKLDAIGTKVDLPKADLDAVTVEVAARRRLAEVDLSRASKDAEAAAQVVSKAELRLKAALGPDTVAVLQRDLDAAREAATTATQRVFLLREYLLQLDSEKAAWEARAAAINLKDPVRARAAYERLTESMAGLRATKQYLEQQLAGAESRLHDEEARQRTASRDDSAASRLLLETLRQRSANLRRALAESQPLERLVAHFRADFQDRRSASFSARLRDHWAAVRLAARDVWNFELFAIEDTFETADGRRIAVSRSVTVGKTFGAALIVLVGYWIAGWVLRLIERRTVARGRATAQAAALVRKWILFVVAAALTLIALFSANIPLTAFAFLGGALAIAAGFGLQTLLKNLVSGVMLLIERPLRLGDLVEVDGIRGRVTEIGIRASTIRSADGIESMIPNSRFLEGNMTNWTYSSAQARQTITVGVAYGTALRKAVELLDDVLERHGLVLKDPKPQVYLDQYGDNAINFSLTYWVEMTEQSDARRVKSDLLLMIDRAFEEAGITIPFPQRDVHLSTAEPVPVAIVGQGSLGRAA